MILGIGTDMVVADDLRRSMERTEGFTARVFHDSEVDYCQSMADPWIHYAARFAAKEAVMKALGSGWSEGVDFPDIVVERGEGGAPGITLKGEAGRRVQEAGGRILISLSHAGGMAVAFAIWSRED